MQCDQIKWNKLPGGDGGDDWSGNDHHNRKSQSWDNRYNRARRVAPGTGRAPNPAATWVLPLPKNTPSNSIQFHPNPTTLLTPPKQKIQQIEDEIENGVCPTHLQDQFPRPKPPIRVRDRTGPPPAGPLRRREKQTDSLTMADRERDVEWVLLTVVFCISFVDWVLFFPFFLISLSLSFCVCCADVFLLSWWC